MGEGEDLAEARNPSLVAGAVAGEMLVSTMVAARLFLENTTDVTLDSGPDKSMLGCWDQGSKVHNGLVVAGLGWRS